MPNRHLIWDNGELKEVYGELHEVLEIDPVIRRMMTYNLGEQLNLLVDDINAGLFGDAAKTGKFMTYINEVKTRHPK
jgi:hypothetical protein